MTHNGTSPSHRHHAKKKGVPRFVKGPSGTRYCIGATLGKGGFGIVKVATDEATGEKFAAKAVDMKIVQRENLLDYVDRETKLATRLSHPHIIKLMEVIELKEECLRLYIMELAPNGELFDQIVAVSRFQESTARRYYQQLIAAVRYCHSKGVVHRDLKAENLLLSRDNTLKICDFGLSRYAGEDAFGDHPIMFTSIAGSLDYQAPEIVRNQKYFGRPADIWSCGVILGFMLSGWLPFQDHAGDAATKRRIMAQPRPEYILHDEVSSGARDLISKCLNPDPEKRITADEIIEHPWFKVGLDNSLRDKLMLSMRVQSPPSQLLSLGDDTLGNLGELDLENIDRSLLHQLRVAFDTIDIDKSGKIRYEELRDVLIKLNGTVPTQEEVRSLLSFFDRDKSGYICFTEFAMGFVESSVESADSVGHRLRLQDLLEQLKQELPFDLRGLDSDYIENLREGFRAIDEDKSGVIHRSELRHLVERTGISDVSDTDLNSLFDQMDVGKNDYITFEEFALAWTAQESTTQTGSHLLQRIKKCKELLFLSEADEARRILYQANLGTKVKGDVAEAKRIARASFQPRDGRVYQVDDSESPVYDELDTINDGFRVSCVENGTTTCEASVVVTPSLSGYANILTRRITGGTTSFHKVYNDFVSQLEQTEQYAQAQEDLAEDGPVVDI
eukprot:TRINITY_DN11499_c0_g1_i1.p1 TRINITY_DN11499_c0_g1~~TRINITY_DN11499_c0_g1_i1.p1  ORF type:complete len:674 (+),score=167.35 TRINITY_DN11499_c0_g1_i1:129-2150(+)